jgi:hypothetical protein
VRTLLFYVEISMRKTVVKKEKKPAAKLAKPWYFTHV